MPAVAVVPGRRWSRARRSSPGHRSCRSCRRTFRRSSSPRRRRRRRRHRTRRASRRGRAGHRRRGRAGARLGGSPSWRGPTAGRGGRGTRPGCADETWVCSFGGAPARRPQRRVRTVSPVCSTSSHAAVDRVKGQMWRNLLKSARVVLISPGEAATVGSMAPTWGMPTMAFGGDYNPEQWPEHVWAEDVELMAAAGVNFVTVGVFAWARLQPRPGTFEADWLGRVLDLLHGGGHPRRPRHRHRVARRRGSPTATPRSSRSTSAARATALGQPPDVVPELARLPRACARPRRPAGDRFGDHPAVTMWHVSNELGCHNARCYCPVSAADVPSLARAALRRPRRAQPGVGHQLLEPGVRRVGRDPDARTQHDVHQPDPAARLRPLQLGRAARPVRRRARRAAGTHAEHPGDDELHHEPRGERRLLLVGARAGPRRQRPLRARCAARPARPPGVRRRPDERRGRRAAVAAHGALDERRQLAAGEPGQGARRDDAHLARPTSRAAPTASPSSSGGRPRPARRSSTRRSCRTPVRTPTDSARSPSSAASSAG